MKEIKKLWPPPPGNCRASFRLIVNGQVLEPSLIFVQPILGKRIEVYKLPDEPLLRRSSLQGLIADRNKTYIRYYFGNSNSTIIALCTHVLFFCFEPILVKIIEV